MPAIAKKLHSIDIDVLGQLRYNNISSRTGIFSIAMQRVMRLQFHSNERPEARHEIHGHCFYSSRSSLSILSLHTHLTTHSLTPFPSTSTFPALNSNVMQHPTLVIQTKLLRNERFGLSTPIYRNVYATLNPRNAPHSYMFSPSAVLPIGRKKLKHEEALREV